MIVPGPVDLAKAREPQMRPEWAQKEEPRLPKPVQTENSFSFLEEVEESFPTLKGSKGRGKSSSKGLGKEEMPVGGKGRGKAGESAAQ